MTTWFKRYWQVSFIGTLILALCIITFTERTESQSAAKAYQIDAVHSSVLFRAKHLGVSYNYGRFNEFSGSIMMDETDVPKSKVEFEVKTASVDTANEKRDQHLRSPDFFNAKQFPVITFKSTKVSAKAGQENMLEVTGDFALHGVKKSITVDVEITGKGKHPQDGELIGFETTFGIKRSEYGMTYGMQGVSDDIRITVSIEAAHK
ncbi:polyisoprenoid-binding protein [Candidatus Poribacteria bacterium]|nr:MAG: polyisoprenoid-binding protein [Candidatus Poribacteria bacterium]